MNARAIIEELVGPTKKLIVVDVQPSLEKDFGKGYLKQVVDEINQATKVLIFFVDEDEYGYDNEDEVREYLESAGAALGHARFVHKGYGWIRPWMDNRYDDVVPTLRRMLQQDIRMSSELDGEEEDEITVPDEEVVAALRDFEGATVIGGARNECVEEILLTAEALDLHLVVNENLCY